MAASLEPGSCHQARSKSRIARSRSESAIGVRLPSGRPKFKDPRGRTAGSGCRRVGLVARRQAIRPSRLRAFGSLGRPPVWRSPVAQATCNRQAVGSNPTTGSFLAALGQASGAALRRGRQAIVAGCRRPPGGQVALQLALDPLEGVVDRLDVPAQAARRSPGRSAPPRRARARRPPGPTASGRATPACRPGPPTTPARRPGRAPGGGAARRQPSGQRRPQGHVLVEGTVLLAGGGLDRGDDLAGDAQLGEGGERRLASGR